MRHEPKPRGESKKSDDRKLYRKGFVIQDISFGREEKAADKENFDRIK